MVGVGSVGVLMAAFVVSVRVAMFTANRRHVFVVVVAVVVTMSVIVNQRLVSVKMAVSFGQV